MKTKLLGELYISFAKIGGLTFGGGMAMLPMLQREIVENRKWCQEEEVLDMYAIGQCTPGVIAVNTATYVGYRQAGILGGIVATFGVISPSIIIICLIASILQNFIHLSVVVHALSGIRAAVCALMINTTIQMIRRGVVDKLGAAIFLISFLLSCFSPVPTALIIILAGIAGITAKKIEGRKLL